ncbi:MAG: T9SS type A sorting domain-containing protein [Saprospiraceae bacterium]|nr:T9SS type A sorting domain-containing protein [Saprospiraceae bacterium]
MRKSKHVFGKQTTLFRTLLVLLIAGWGQANLSAQNCTLGCNDLVQFSLDQDCYSELLPDHILEAPQSCPGPKEVTVMGANGQPIPTSPYVGVDYIGQTLTVKVTHPGSGNHCWGSILVEDKLAPAIDCEDITIWCSETNISPAFLGYPIVEDNCDPYYKLTWNDATTTLPCGGPWSAIIARSWRATDFSGNSSTCIQNIYFQRATLADFVFPLNRDDIQAPALLCGNPNTEPSNTGWPTVDGKPIGGFCDLVATYTDQSTSMCQGNLTIFRSWIVMDMCAGTTSSQIQVIKVLDKLGPNLTCPTDPEHQIVVLDYLSGPQYNGCLAVVKFPQIQVNDNCSSYAKLKFLLYTEINGFLYSIPSNGGTLTLPLGTHTFYYKATDDCGNSNTCSFEFTVVDKVPPVVACETLHTVALSEDVTLVNAATFDDGSYDACSGVTFQVSRTDNPKCNFKNGTTFGPTAPFYCCDINNGPVMVTLRVYDAAGNYNQCMTLVEVVDKVTPTIWCPKDITVQCGMPYTPTQPLTYSTGVKPNQAISPSYAFTYQVPIDISGIDPTAEIIDLDVFLDLTHDYVDQLKIKLVSPNGTKVALFDGGVCGIGKADILATFNDEGLNFNCSGPNPAIQGNIKSQGDLLSFFDGEGLNSIVINQNNKLTWLLEVEDSAPLGGGKINEVKLFFTYGTPLALKPKVHDNTEACGLTVTWKDLDVADKCPTGFVRREWKVVDAFGLAATCIQRIYFYDDTPWEVTFPEDITIEDCTDLNDLTNLGNVQHNGDCEMVGVEFKDKVLTVVPDACYKIERTWTLVDWCKYDKFGNNTKLGIALPHPKGLKFRDNGDGYFEWVQVIKVIDKTAPKIFCPADLTVLNMEPDCGPTYVQPDQVVVIDCSPSIKGTISIDLYNDGTINIIKTGLVADGEYPNGVHRIHFKVEDGCNNFSTCSFLMTVIDGKKPQASCKNINIDLMAMNGGGMAQITTSMINLASTDNCTPDFKLLMSVSPNVFMCEDLGPNEVTLTVVDEEGNFDVCIAIVNVQDNMNVCPGNANGSIQGFVGDNNKDAVENAEISIANMNGISTITGTNGSFNFGGLVPGEGYIIQPVKDDHHLNGVSTYDILMIQKHLLGIKALPTPLKLIAADVNKTDNITISDIIDLRKALLSATPFTKNDSWRFIESGYVFLNPTNPFAENWPEVIDIKELPETGMTVEFTGIKIGDVSGDALPNTLLGSETRNLAGTLLFETKDMDLEAGTTIAMPVRAIDIRNMEGFQFTMAFEANVLQFAGIEAGQLATFGQDNIGTRFADEGYLTASWNGKTEEVTDETVLFTVLFRVNQAARLSDVVGINSMYLTAEGYDNTDNLYDATLRFTGSNGQTIAGQEFALYQNRPNPFRNETLIGFELPQAGAATLTITDVSGRVLHVVEGDFARGYNEFRIQRSDVHTSGVVYYRLTADGFAATRKMIIID